MLETSDFATIHLILSDRSRGLIGEREISRMKKSAYLINTSRGPIVDEAALISALQNNTIAGAAVDVYDVEPLPVDHTFRKLPNALLAPHLGYVTRENYATMYTQAVENILAYAKGEPRRVLND